jgi:hypothetical protein
MILSPEESLFAAAFPSPENSGQMESGSATGEKIGDEPNDIA